MSKEEEVNKICTTLHKLWYDPRDQRGTEKLNKVENGTAYKRYLKRFRNYEWSFVETKLDNNCNILDNIKYLEGDFKNDKYFECRKYLMEERSKIRNSTNGALTDSQIYDKILYYPKDV